METFETIITIAMGIYEVVSRAIPKTKVWSIIGNLLLVLQKISESLDNKTIQKKTTRSK